MYVLYVNLEQVMRQNRFRRATFQFYVNSTTTTNNKNTRTISSRAILSFNLPTYDGAVSATSKECEKTSVIISELREIEGEAAVSVSLAEI